ncbi:MAG: molybdenum cofactor guanylyltransferase [Terriglobia bacterium]
MNPQKHQVIRAGGFVLAGGASRRMGREKGLLEIGGEPLFLRAANLLKAWVHPVVLLGAPDQYARSGFPTLPDRSPGQGPLSALVDGLEYSALPWNIFLACDLPLLRGEFIELLLQRAARDEFDAIVPKTNDGWQPLSAAYRRTCAPKIRDALKIGRLDVAGVLPDLRVDAVQREQLRELALDDEIFENVNTPEDWQRVLLRTQAHSLQRQRQKPF